MTEVLTTCAEAIFRVKTLSRQLRTPITQVIFFNQGMLLLRLNHLNQGSIMLHALQHDYDGQAALEGNRP